LSPTGNLPLIIVVAQTDNGKAFSEYFIFTGMEKHPFIYGGTGYDTGSNITEADFNRLVTPEDILELQLAVAKAQLENTIYNMDKEFHRAIILEGRRFEFEPTNDTPFRCLAMDKRFKSDIGAMFAKTNSQALAPLKTVFNVLSQINIKPDK
jgi:hypothetical protein